MQYQTTLIRALEINEPAMAIYALIRISETHKYLFLRELLGSTSDSLKASKSPLKELFQQLSSILWQTQEKIQHDHPGTVHNKALKILSTPGKLKHEIRDSLLIAHEILHNHFGLTALERTPPILKELLTELIHASSDLPPPTGTWPVQYYIADDKSYYLSPYHATPIEIDISDPTAYGSSIAKPSVKKAAYYRITNRLCATRIGNHFLEHAMCTIVDFSQCGHVKTIGDNFMSNCLVYCYAYVGSEIKHDFTGLLNVTSFGENVFAKIMHTSPHYWQLSFMKHTPLAGYLITRGMPLIDHTLYNMGLPEEKLQIYKKALARQDKIASLLETELTASLNPTAENESIFAYQRATLGID